MTIERDGIYTPAMQEHVRRVQAVSDRVRIANMRVLRHETETPMRGHDEDGMCCLRAQLTPLPEEQDWKP